MVYNFVTINMPLFYFLQDIKDYYWRNYLVHLHIISIMLADKKAVYCRLPIPMMVSLSEALSLAFQPAALSTSQHWSMLSPPVNVFFILQCLILSFMKVTLQPEKCLAIAMHKNSDSSYSSVGAIEAEVRPWSHEHKGL